MRSDDQPESVTDEASGAAPGFTPINGALRALAAGRMIIVVDAPERENEGDFVIAADAVSPDAINFMATHGRGLICVSMAAKRLTELGIPPMARESMDIHQTAFHVGVDRRDLATAGGSAADRAATARALADPSARGYDFRKPGRVFPLAARDGGVLVRAGHTEAAVDLVTLAGRTPAGVICEIASADGEMARVPELLEIARKHVMPIVAISDLVAYRKRTEHLVDRTGVAQLPLEGATFTAVGYRERQTGTEHLAMTLGDLSGSPPLVHVHAECLTGDVFGSRRCDCGTRIDQALRRIVEAGRGVVIYQRGHQGRGSGLSEKLRAYRLEEERLDTVEERAALGHSGDAREFMPAAHILRDLGVGEVRLLTHDRAKVVALEGLGLTVTQESMPAAATAASARYRGAKREKRGYRFSGELATRAKVEVSMSSAAAHQAERG